MKGLIKNHIKKIIATFVLVVGGGVSLGVALPQAVGIFETSLQTGITSSATSMTLTENSIRGGGSLSGYNCFTLDEGNTNAEVVCGTVATLAVTSLERGISYENGTSTVATNQFSHRRGANVKITDFPIVQRLKAQNNGEDTFPNILLYDTAPTFTNALSLITKGYADNLTNQGAATSSETIAGIIEQATLLETASSTPFDSDNPHAINSEHATSSPGIDAAGYIPASKTNGYLSQLWLDLTEAFTWTGAHIFNTATTTFNSGVDIDADSDSPIILNTQEYVFPANDGTASSTVLTTDGSGNLSFNAISAVAASTTMMYSTTTESTAVAAAETNLLSFTVPAGSLANGEVYHTRIDVSDLDLDATVPGGTHTVALKFKFGGTTFSTVTLSSTAGGGTTDYLGVIDFYILSTGASSQTAYITGDFSKQVVTATVTNTPEIYFRSSGTSAVSSASDQTLVVTGEASNSAANISITVASAFGFLYR